MTARKSAAPDRIIAAYSALLASVRITPDMSTAVQDALIQRGDYIESRVLAGLAGRLSGAVLGGRPLSPTRLAEIVEAVCDEGAQEATALIAATTAKETGE